MTTYDILSGMILQVLPQLPHFPNEEIAGELVMPIIVPQ